MVAPVAMAEDRSEMRARVEALLQKRDAIEAEMEAITSRLEQPGQPGFSEPLVDREGFPRADVDVYRVRGDRHRHACLRNDYKEVMDALQHALEDLHSAARAAGNISEGRPRQPAPSGQGADVAGVSTAGARPPMPFAVVDELFEGSPAKACGLALGDMVCAMGPVDRRNCATDAEALHQVAKELPKLEGSRVPVLVQRGSGEVVSFTLVPSSAWGGRGLLGCHLTLIRP